MEVSLPHEGRGSLGLQLPHRSKAQLYLHRPTAVSCKLKGRLHLIEAIATRQQRLEVNRAAIDEIDGEGTTRCAPADVEAAVERAFARSVGLQ